MSRFKGAFAGLALATVFGVANGRFTVLPFTVQLGNAQGRTLIAVNPYSQIKPSCVLKVRRFDTMFSMPYPGRLRNLSTYISHAPLLSTKLDADKNTDKRQA